jgi:DNA polymerase-4
MPVFRWVLHVDLDQFLAAVEVRRHPELRGRPVVVGGDGDPTRRRQVVSTASAEARRLGVRSGMPLSTALRRCPDAVFLPVDKDAYDAASEQVWTVIRELPATVEVWGWDEGFLGTDDDPVERAEQVRDQVGRRTGLTCCVGIGDTKVRAKTATGFAKAPPGVPPEDAPGVAMLTRETWFDVMGSRGPDALWGVGGRTAAKLAEVGLTTVAALAAADEQMLAERFGPTTGPWLRCLAHGAGSRDVSDEPWVPRGHSHEQTYEFDLIERAEIESRLRDLARRVVEDVAPQGRAITHVAIKVRFAPYLTSTRVTKLSRPTTDDAEVAATAVRLLERFDEIRPVRLLGVRVDLAAP